MSNPLPLEDVLYEKATAGAQTLMRGLDVLDAVSRGPLNLIDLAESIGLSRSTTHRLAAALIERRFITLRPREGYALGPKLLELGGAAREQVRLTRAARAMLEDLAQVTKDSVHLGVRDGFSVLYLDKVKGSRRVSVSSQIGERQPLTSTGLGKALLLDLDNQGWRELHLAVHPEASSGDRALWLERIRIYAERGCAFDLEENEDQIRCVAAPVRDVEGRIVAAISVSSAAQYMDDERMILLSTEVQNTCRALSMDLGWSQRTECVVP